MILHTSFNFNAFIGNPFSNTYFPYFHLPAHKSLATYKYTLYFNVLEKIVYFLPDPKNAPIINTFGFPTSLNLKEL